MCFVKAQSWIVKFLSISFIYLFFQENATKVVRLFEDVFSWLPLATVIDQKVLVAHGGISSKTDLDYMASIDRHKVNTY